VSLQLDGADTGLLSGDTRILEEMSGGGGSASGTSISPAPTSTDGPTITDGGGGGGGGNGGGDLGGSIPDCAGCGSPPPPTIGPGPTDTGGLGPQAPASESPSGGSRVVNGPSLACFAHVLSAGRALLDGDQETAKFEAGQVSTVCWIVLAVLAYLVLRRK